MEGSRAQALEYNVAGCVEFDEVGAVIVLQLKVFNERVSLVSAQTEFFPEIRKFGGKLLQGPASPVVQRFVFLAQERPSYRHRILLFANPKDHLLSTIVRSG